MSSCRTCDLITVWFSCVNYQTGNWQGGQVVSEVVSRKLIGWSSSFQRGSSFQSSLQEVKVSSHRKPTGEIKHKFTTPSWFWLAQIAVNYSRNHWQKYKKASLPWWGSLLHSVLRRLATDKIEHMSELYSSSVELLWLKFNVNMEIRQILSSKFTPEVTVP